MMAMDKPTYYMMSRVMMVLVLVPSGLLGVLGFFAPEKGAVALNLVPLEEYKTLGNTP